MIQPQTDSRGSPAPSVAERSLNAVKSNYIGTAVRIGAQFISQIFITRALGPELVGTYGYSVLLCGVLALIIDQGFGWSLVREKFEDSEETSVVFSRIMLVSLLCAISVYFLSYPLAHALQNKLAGEVFRFTSPLYVLVGLFVVTQARLRAELRFTEIQKAITGSYLAGYAVVGVTMALAGWGVWSLVAAWYVSSILEVIIAFYYAPHSLKLTNPFKRTKSGRLGRHVAGINLVNWAADNTAGIFVGWLGAAALGNFNAAMMLARTPTLHLVQTLQTILFSTASALKNDQDAIRRMYLGALAVIGFVVIPAYSYAMVNAALIVHLVFGEKWQAAADVLSMVAMGMVALGMRALSGPILTANGAERAVLLSQCFALLISLAILYGAVYGADSCGLACIGLSVTVANVLAAIIQIVVLARFKMVSAVEFCRALRGPVVISLIAAVPLEHLLASGSRTIYIAAAVLGVKCTLAAMLIRRFPRFFLDPALLQVMSKLNLGRRLLRALAL